MEKNRKGSTKKPIRKKTGIENRNNKKEIIVAIIILFAAVMFLWYFNFSKPLKIVELEVRFDVGDKIGVSVNQTEIDFGIVFPASASEKVVIFTNSYEFPVDVKVFISKEISDFVFSDYEFTIGFNETKKQRFILSVPENANKQEYSGKVRFEFRKLGE